MTSAKLVFTAVPVLKGRNILLRQLTEADAPALAANMSVEVAKWLRIHTPYTEEHALQFVRKSKERFLTGREIDFGIESEGR